MKYESKWFLDLLPGQVIFDNSDFTYGTIRHGRWQTSGVYSEKAGEGVYIEWENEEGGTQSAGVELYSEEEIENFELYDGELTWKNF